MKKFLLIIVMLLSFCFCNNKVYAANELAYQIQNMTIGNDYIIFEGWAFIKNVHNNYNGNTAEITISSYTSEGEFISNAEIVGKDDRMGRAIYESLCLRYNGVGKECTVLYDQSDAEGNGNSCENSGRNCRYDNAWFKARIKISDLYNAANNKEVSFKIKVKVRDLEVEEDLTVYSAYYHDNNQKINYNVQFIQGADKIKVIVNGARVLTQGGAFKQGAAFYFENGKNYKLSGTELYYLRSGSKYAGLPLYRISFGGVSNYQCNNNSSLSATATTDGTCKGFLYATWGKVVGNRIVIKVSDPPVSEESCDVVDNPNLTCNNHNYSSSCNYDITSSQSYDIYYDDSSLANCGTTLSTEVYVTGKVKIKQTGELMFGLNRGPIYSGGGFEYNISYSNTASWDFLTEPSQSNCPSQYLAHGCSIQYTRCYTRNCTPYPYCSCSYGYLYPSECDTKEEYIDIIENEVEKKYLTLNNSSIYTEWPDSNVVGQNDTNVGIWECTNNLFDEGWDRTEEIKQTCTFTLHNAFINKNTSKVVYGNASLNEYLNGNSDSGEPLYYIPLKMPSGQFYVKANLTGLSSISGMRWNADYTCDVECRQKLYDLSNGGYLYYFRPIALNNPFPNGRNPGVNWIDWVEVTQNKERLLETYTSTNNIEYTVTLTNNDIANIKSYNQNKLYGGGRGYLDYSIDSNGNSDFIKTYDIFINGNVNHSALGVYNAGDDRR